MKAILFLFLKYAADHWAAFTTVCGALGVASICTMPPNPPGFLKYLFTQDMWTWLRDTLQTAVPAARHKHENPTPPAEPAKK